MKRRDPQQFARLVRVRQRQADVRAYALAEAKRAVAAAKQDRAVLEARQREILAQTGEALAHVIEIPRVQQFAQYERHLAARAVEADSQIRALEAEAEIRRVALEDAVKARRMAEKLHERAAERYAAQVRRAEQMALDEIASVRSARNRIRSATRTKLREAG